MIEAHGLQSAWEGAPALVVAVDVPDAERALSLADGLAGLPLWLKVGLELFTAEGPALLRILRRRGQPVFLDLKFHDIPNTVAGAAKSAIRIGAEMLTLHMAGGERMIEAALKARQEALEEVQGQTPCARTPIFLGVTVLTSDAVGDDAAERVVASAVRAKSWGLDGVVCSGLEAAAVKAACGREFVCLCPGIRFAGEAGGDDQTRVCTPEYAVRAGADFVVMGRPITRAADPALAAARALDAMVLPQSGGAAGR